MRIYLPRQQRTGGNRCQGIEARCCGDLWLRPRSYSLRATCAGTTSLALWGSVLADRSLNKEVQHELRETLGLPGAAPRCNSGAGFGRACRSRFGGARAGGHATESPRRQPRQPRGPVGGEHARDSSAAHAVLPPDPAAAPTADRPVDAASARPPEHPQRLLGRQLGRPPLRCLLHRQHRRDDTEARRQQLLRLRGAVRRRPRVVRRLGYRGRLPESLLEQPGIDDELPRHLVLHRMRDERFFPDRSTVAFPAGAV